MQDFSTSVTADRIFIALGEELVQAKLATFDKDGDPFASVEVDLSVEGTLPDYLRALASHTSQMVAAFPGSVSPSVITDLLNAFLAAFTPNTSLDDPTSMLQPLNEAEPYVLAPMLLQMIGSLGECGLDGASRITAKGKVAAVETGEALGPDHAQTLYHFARLVTKLA